MQDLHQSTNRVILKYDGDALSPVNARERCNQSVIKAALKISRLRSFKESSELN